MRRNRGRARHSIRWIPPFVNASTQIGSFLYNVHSIDVAGAAVRRYHLNVPAGISASTISFFSSATSSDFNASIAVNDVLSEYITFSQRHRDLPPGPVRGQAVGRRALRSGQASTSPTFLSGNPGRWGDYSAITIDPTSTNNAWGVNEKANANHTWGSRIFKIGIP